MAGRLFRTLSCFKYDSGFPKISLKLTNYLGETRRIDFKVDTGFSGGIMVLKNDYEFFACGELPKSLWRSYLTIMGRVPMRTARAIVQIEEVKAKFETYVETPVYGVGKRLVGREVINQLTLLFDGPKLNCCICKRA